MLESQKSIRIRRIKNKYGCSDWNAILLFQFEELSAEYSKFMEVTCGINFADDDPSYKVEQTVDDFLNATMQLEKRLVNINQIIKTQYPTVSTYYTGLITDIRNRIRELNMAGERMTLGRLHRDIKIINFEFLSAIESGSPDMVLGLTEYNYRNDEKLYKDALKSLGHKNFDGIMVLQCLMEVGGKFMRAKDIAEKKGVAESSATKGMNQLIDNCMEILIATNIEGARALAIPTAYLRFKQVK